MKIAVIGSGNVGGTLGRAWVRAGHQVVFGTRGEPGGSIIAGAGYAPVAQAIQDAEVVVLVVPWAAVPEVIGQAKHWSAKILMDCTNPIGPCVEKCPTPDFREGLSWPTPYYSVDRLPPPVVDYLPLWPSNHPETESNSFTARSTC